MGTVAYAVPRDAQTRMIASALGSQGEGEALIARANAEFASAVGANPAFSGRVGAVALPARRPRRRDADAVLQQGAGRGLTGLSA